MKRLTLMLSAREIKLLKDLLYNETQMNEYGAAVMARKVHEKIEGAE